jgi:coenzyme F420 hydrogenase subunit beta
MSTLGPSELIADVYSKELCIGCGACVSLCPYLKNYKGKTVMLFPCTLPAGRCYAYCPKAEVDLDRLSLQFRGKPYTGEPLGAYENVLASRSGKRPVGVAYQAGGTVSALISFALDEKFIEAAVLTDREGLVPVSKLVIDPDDVKHCAGSKFMAAPTLSALNEGIREGRTRMGVVGTPCQMTALLQLRSNPLNLPDFKDPVGLSIGLFCNWSLDTRLLANYLKDKIDIKRLQGMDIPPPPASVLSLITDDGQQEIPLSEIKPLIPHTCYICPDMTSEFADISVGMYEGRPGWNTLIVRSQKGADLLSRAVDKGVVEVADMQKENIERLSKAAADKKARALRMLVRRDLLNTEGEGKRSAMRIPPAVVDKILGEGAI